MRDRILEIVVFLMDNMRDNTARSGEADDFSATLKTMGYSDNEISSAYFWLMNRFDDSPEQLFSEFPEAHIGNRILSSSERVRLSTDAYGFLIKLLNHSLIDAEQFEDILERVAIFGSDPVSADQMKLIASSIVFNEFEEPDGDELIDQIGKSPNQVN